MCYKLRIQSNPYKTYHQILLLYTGAVMQDLAVDQHSTWNRPALNQPHRGYLMIVKPSAKDPPYNALHCPCLVREHFYIYLLMSACHNLRMHSPLKKVLSKLGDSYQTYLNMYKTHTLATHHRGTGQPSEMDPNSQAQDIDTPNDYQGDIDDFENIEHENHMQLKELTNKLDQLWHKVKAAKNQPTDTINCLECELHRLSLALQPSAPPEPLDEVLQQYTETLCTAQKKTTCKYPASRYNNLQWKWFHTVRWLVNRYRNCHQSSSESRTKLAQAKSKGLPTHWYQKH